MKSLYTSGSKQNKLLMLVICILLAASLLITGGCSNANEVRERQQGITAYLNDRYGMEFEVDTPYITGNGYAAHYLAKAHPKGQPEVQFIVSDAASVKNPQATPPTPRFTDDYLGAKWSYQGKQKIEKKLREVYGLDVDFNIREYKFGVGHYAFKDLDFTQVFEKSHGQGVIHFHYDIFMDDTQFIKATEAEKAYQLLKPFVLDHGTNSYMFSVTFIKKAYKQEYLADPNSFTNKKDYKEKHLGSLTILSSVPPATTGINSSSDLLKFF